MLWTDIIVWIALILFIWMGVKDQPNNPITKMTRGIIDWIKGKW